MTIGVNFILATLILTASGAKPGRSQVCQPDQIVDFWQSRLHLDDWHIRVSFATPTEIGPEMLGEIEYHEKTRIAVIRILNPSERLGELSHEEAARECENTVVHELVHLLLHRLMPPVDTDEEERVVVHLSEALLASEREGELRNTERSSSLSANSKHAPKAQHQSVARLPR